MKHLDQRGWKPNPVLHELKTWARENGFCLETDGLFG
jgi:hypothetical protein